MYCAKRLIEHFPELRDTEEFEKLPSKVKLRAKNMWEKNKEEMERQEKIKKAKEEEAALKKFLQAQKAEVKVEPPKPKVEAKPIPMPTAKANRGRKEMEDLESKYLVNKGKKN